MVPFVLAVVLKAMAHFTQDVVSNNEQPFNKNQVHY
jgi:hypothetical protein